MLYGSFSITSSSYTHAHFILGLLLRIREQRASAYHFPALSNQRLHSQVYAIEEACDHHLSVLSPDWCAHRTVTCGAQST